VSGLRRALRPLLADERGLTLVELMMASAILSLVLAASAAALASYQRTAAGSDVRLENLTEAQAIMDVVSRDIRTATRPGAGQSPFLYAGANEVQFYANLRTVTGPKYVRLYVDSVTGRVIEEATEPTGSPPYVYPTSYPASGAVVRVVGRHFANAPSQPLLTYLDDEGNVLSGNPLTADQRLQIDSVRIDLSIRKSTSLSVRATTVRTTVRLPNVEYTPISTP
jgi:prepilin-type N-terminal cleavage/methylation domain-containing protein